MKRRELMLDFTSLLDVIMILLFVVIGNISQTTQASTAASNAALEEAQTKVEALTSENAELQEKYDALSDDYDYLKITSDYDANDTSVYKAAIEKTTKVILYCKASINIESQKPEVTVSISTANEDEVETVNGKLKIEHDLSLPKAEREKRNSEYEIELTKLLAQSYKEDSNPLILFFIQYEYNDEDISYSDLEIIRKAIDNFSRNFSKSCCTEELKLY
jgi:hypothetical protein